MALTNNVIEKALELGFVAAGVAPAQRLGFHEQALRRRMAAGGLEGLGYFTPERAAMAADPRALLPGAQAVLSLALPLDATPASPPAPGHGRVARYAQGRDYHRRAREGLGALVAFIGAQAGTRSRAFVDATPLLERAFAAKAGLGSFGKNNCLITPARGSWVALAEIVTEAPLTPDFTGPAPDVCGACDACLRACPTGALATPYEHRASQCLSFLTTELRGPIPRSLRPQLGNRVLGCDSCQCICPRNAATAQDAAPAGEGLPAWLDLRGLLALDDRNFACRFGGTAAARAKRAGLLRNAAVALGNEGDPGAVPALSRALDDTEPLVRGHAAWALGRIGGGAAHMALERALAGETEAGVRGEIRCALGEEAETQDL